MPAPATTVKRTPEVFLYPEAPGSVRSADAGIELAGYIVLRPRTTWMIARMMAAMSRR